MTIHKEMLDESDSDQAQEEGRETQTRLRREDPGRDKPIRSWSGLYRRPPVWDTMAFAPQASPTNGAQPTDAQDDTVSRGVKLGYHVVEEHIRQGRRVAQQLSGRASGTGKDANDLGALFGRMARYYTDLGSLWSDVLNTLVADPEFVNTFLGFLSPSAASSPNTNGARTAAEPASMSVTVSVAISTKRPSQVMIDLRPQTPGCVLTTAGLYAINPATPPLVDIQFTSSPSPGVIMLHIGIPEGQTPDVYTGVIVDKRTNLPQGTLSVRVMDA